MGDCWAALARTSNASPRKSSPVKCSSWVMHRKARPGKCLIIFSVSSFIKTYAQEFCVAAQMLDSQGFVLEASLPRGPVWGARPSQGNANTCQLPELLKTRAPLAKPAPRCARSPSRCLHVPPSLPKMKVAPHHSEFGEPDFSPHLQPMSPDPSHSWLQPHLLAVFVNGAVFPF